MSNSQRLDILAQEHGKVLCESSHWMGRALNAERKLQNMAPSERTTAGGQPVSQYWRHAWRKACDRERETMIACREVEDQSDSLTVELNSMKAQRDRAQKEARNLRKKLAAVEASTQEDAKVAQLFREHLDDSAQDAESDNEWEAQARQITRNEVDAWAASWEPE